ncbi:MAG: hypothetical protein U0325_02245 [Polyangiales bacterium]
MRTPPLLLPLLLATARCVGADALGTAPAVYFVPPRTAASTYPVTDVSWRIEAGEARLSYTLPRLLVGGSGRVSFRGGPSGPGVYQLQGPEGVARCAVAPSPDVALRCDERFTGLAVDLEAVRREAVATDPTTADARVAVSRAFSIEPIGVLEVSAR